MAQISDVAVEPSTTGLALGTAARTWDLYSRYMLQLQRIDMQGIAAPAVSAFGSCRLYCDTNGVLKISQNAGAYANISGSQPPFDYNNVLLDDGTGSSTGSIIIKRVSGTTPITASFPNTAALTVASINVTQTFTATPTFNGADILAQQHTEKLGQTASGWWGQVVAIQAFTEQLKICQAANLFTPFWKFALLNANTLYLYDNNNAVAFGITSDTKVAAFAVDVVADANNTRDMGTSSDRWKKLYVVDIDVSGSISISNLVPSATSTYNLGSAAKTWASVFTDNLKSTQVNIYNSIYNKNWYLVQLGGYDALSLYDAAARETLRFTSTGTIASCNMHWTPYADTTFTLGNTNNRWAKTWSNVLDIGTTGGGSAYIDIETGTGPAVSAAGQARMYYDGTNIKVSKNGAAYATLI